MGNRQINYGPEAVAWGNARERAISLASFLKRECKGSHFDEIDFIERATRIFFEEEFYKLVA